MGERLLVLALGERVDGPELLAAARRAARACASIVGALARSSSELLGGASARGRAWRRSCASSAAASPRRSPRCATRTSASVTASPAARSCAWISASSREQARRRSVTASSPALAEHPPLERRGTLAGGVARVGGGLAELAERGDQLGLALEPLRERVLGAAAEHVLDPARHLGGALGGLADRSPARHRGRASALAARACVERLRSRRRATRRSARSRRRPGRRRRALRSPRRARRRARRARRGGARALRQARRGARRAPRRGR